MNRPGDAGHGTWPSRLGSVDTLALSFILAIAVAGCERDRTVIRGTLAGDAETCAELGVQSVFVEGAADTVPIRNCRFRLAVRDSGDLVLAFADEDEVEARMYLDGIPARSDLRLERIDLDGRNLAIPGSVFLNGPDLISINGLHVGDSRRLPRRIDAQGIVLGVSEGSGLLLVRPDDATLPDLRVQLDTTAEVLTTANTPGSLGTLGFADRVSVEGVTQSGVVVARRVVVPAPPQPAPRGGQRPSIWDELEKLLESFRVRISR